MKQIDSRRSSTSVSKSKTPTKYEVSATTLLATSDPPPPPSAAFGRNVEGSLRQKDSKRADQRKERDERKKESRKQLDEEIKQIKTATKNAIIDRVKKIQ